MIQFINIAANLNYNDYNLLIRNTFSDMCIYNKSPFERFHGLLRLSYRTHNSIKINNVINLPLKRVWNPFVLDKGSKEKAKCREGVCFILDGSAYRFVQCGLIKYLRRKYKNCYIVFKFDGKVDTFKREYRDFSMDFLKKECDLVVTYNALDVMEYDIKMLKSKIIDYNVKEYEGKAEKSDAFFVGAAKDRLPKILEVFNALNDAGFKCDFHITDVAEEDQQYSESISYNKRISYKEVLSRVAATKCVVNILEGGNSGLTLRDYEAIGFGKILITDNKMFRDTELFVKENVIFTEELEASIDKIQNSTIPVYWHIKEELGEKQYYEWLEEELRKTRMEK